MTTNTSTNILMKHVLSVALSLALSNGMLAQVRAPGFIVKKGSKDTIFGPVQYVGPNSDVIEIFLITDKRRYPYTAREVASFGVKNGAFFTSASVSFDTRLPHTTSPAMTQSDDIFIAPVVLGKKLSLFRYNHLVGNRDDEGVQYNKDIYYIIRDSTGKYIDLIDDNRYSDSLDFRAQLSKYALGMQEEEMILKIITAARFRQNDISSVIKLINGYDNYTVLDRRSDIVKLMNQHVRVSYPIPRAPWKLSWHPFLNVGIGEIKPRVVGDRFESGELNCYEMPYETIFGGVEVKEISRGLLSLRGQVNYSVFRCVGAGIGFGTRTREYDNTYFGHTNHLIYSSLVLLGNSHIRMTRKSALDMYLGGGIGVGYVWYTNKVWRILDLGSWFDRTGDLQLAKTCWPVHLAFGTRIGSRFKIEYNVISYSFVHKKPFIRFRSLVGALSVGFQL